MTIAREDTNGFFPTFEFLQNGNILLIGHCKLLDTLTKFDHLWLCEIDTNLNIVQEKTFNMLKDDYYEYYSWYSLIDSSGAIIIAGNFKYYPGHYDMVYSKVSQNADTVFTMSFSYEFSQLAGQIFLQPDGKYLSIVERILLTHPLSLVELDSNLEMFSITPTSSEYNDYQGTTITYLTDSSYLHSGFRYDYNTESMQTGVTIEDHHHHFIHEVIFNRIDTNELPAFNFSHSYINDSTIYVCSYQSFNDFYILNPSRIFLYLIDKDLNVLGHLDIGGDVNYEIWGITASNEGGCLIYGIIYDNPDGIQEYDVYIRKIAREEFNLVSEIREKKLTQNLVKVYPVPSKNYLVVELNASVANPIMSVLNLNGQLIYNQSLINGRNNIDISQLTPGMYLYQIQFNNQGSESGKFIKY